MTQRSPRVIMHLLETSTLTVHEFSAGQTKVPDHEIVCHEYHCRKHIPEYVIISHVWEEEEVTFQALQNGTAKALKGYDKLSRMCAKAARTGCDFIWIDSCCIDKSSTAELSEAINSMWKWYAEASVCWVYLFDVTTKSTDPDHEKELSESKWFTRGWTLQELLAPWLTVFFNRDWIEIGERDELAYQIGEITGIKDLDNSDDASIAQEMSWASTRETTREEDMAYCLMGLSKVNMPILYGEGANAFRRLQLEILKVSDDESLFAWSDDYLDEGLDRGMLAPSPAAFRGCGQIERYESATGSEPVPYAMTNKGLYMQLALSGAGLRGHEQAVAPLRCIKSTEDSS